MCLPATSWRCNKGFSEPRYEQQVGAIIAVALSAAAPWTGGSLERVAEDRPALAEHHDLKRRRYRQSVFGLIVLHIPTAVEGRADQRDVGAEMMPPNPNSDPAAQLPEKGRKKKSN